jgi:hypothetical protein
MGNNLQSSYSRYATDGAAGAPATMTGWDADARNLESASCPFGYAVSQGVADTGAIKAGPTFCGIAIRDVAIEHDTPDQFEQYDEMAVMVRGDIWVTVGTNVVAGRQAYYNSSSGQLGASGISNAVAIAGAKWLDTVTSGGLARVRLSNAVGDLTT